MITISLAMIVKNEEAVLDRCLKTIYDLVDEIIIVDTGSTDNTVKIARQYTDKIHYFEWVDDFSQARNYAFSKASCEYIMWLDADDVIQEEDRAKFIQMKETMDHNVSMVMMKYNVSFDEGGKPTMSYSRERIMRRDLDFQWVGPIHEVIPPAGNIVYEDIAVSHKKIRQNEKERNLKILQKMLSSGGTLDPRQAFYYGRELYYNARYEDASLKLQEFLEEEQGWVENKIEACRDLAKCHSQRGQGKNEMDALLQSFKFDVPRAEICCDIGDLFLRKNQFKTAAFWFEQARNLTPEINRGGFCLEECYGYIPCIQLCVCYDKMGLYQKAEELNEEAEKWKPKDEAVSFNRDYFKKIKK